jgi:anti-sigma factor ChrR (cupin superfamily)
MELRAKFDQREVVRPGDEAWRPSPMAGVERQMLDRIGEEVARATSIVRYAASARFSAHTHGGGEEFFVLAGSFHDDAGNYPEGTYVRNPIGSSHAPWAGPDGAVLFVKLHQFVATDTRHIVIDTRTATWREGRAGALVLALHAHGSEQVCIVRWPASTRLVRHGHPGGEELLVLEGSFEDDHGAYPKGSWLRSPDRSEHAPVTGPEGAVLYMKTGHLPGYTGTL